VCFFTDANRDLDKSNTKVAEENKPGLEMVDNPLFE
jgi:hypothetical protein